MSNFYNGFVRNPYKVQRSPFERIEDFLWHKLSKTLPVQSQQLEQSLNYVHS